MCANAGIYRNIVGLTYVDAKLAHFEVLNMIVSSHADYYRIVRKTYKVVPLVYNNTQLLNFRCIIGQQFINLRAGDRYFYATRGQEGSFTSGEQQGPVS